MSMRTKDNSLIIRNKHTHSTAVINEFKYGIANFLQSVVIHVANTMFKERE